MARTSIAARKLIRDWFGSRLVRILQKNGYGTDLRTVWTKGWRNQKTFDEREYPVAQVVFGNTLPRRRDGALGLHESVLTVYVWLTSRDPQPQAYRRAELEEASETLREDAWASILSAPKIEGLAGPAVAMWIDEKYEPTDPEWAHRLLEFEVAYYEQTT